MEKELLKKPEEKQPELSAGKEEKKKDVVKDMGKAIAGTGFNEAGWKGDDYAYGKKEEEKKTSVVLDKKDETQDPPSDIIPELPPEIKIASWVKILNTRLEAQYGKDYIPLPPVIMDLPEDTFSNAVFRDSDCMIHVGPETQWTTTDDNVSMLYHEYTHYLNYIHDKYPLGKDTNGAIIQFNTDETISFPATETDRIQLGEGFDEIEAPKYKLQGLKDDEIAKKRAEYIDKYAIPETISFKYGPSNLALDELSAYQAQLDGEKLGFYKLSDNTRQDIKDRIIEFQIKYAKRVEYEKNHNLNPDGTPK